jgi:hypothetical protein
MQPFKKQTIPELYTGRARNQVTTKNGHFGHCTNIAESANTEVPNIQRLVMSLRVP